jgi:hypothetical protein
LVVLAYMQSDENDKNVRIPAIFELIRRDADWAIGFVLLIWASVCLFFVRLAVQAQAQRPELRIVSRTNEEVSSDALTILGFERYQPGDYRLDHMAAESLFYVVSPKDVVVAKPRDTDDHIAWLLQNEKCADSSLPPFVSSLSARCRR